MPKLSVDLETRSPVDLINEGGWNYAAHLQTDVICLAYALNYGEPELWIPGNPVPDVFYQPDLTFGAWNADGFERLIWDFILTPEYEFPQIHAEQWQCTAFKARCNNLPNKLENAARVLRTPMQKQSRGRELIKLLCIPLPDGTFCTDPQLLQEMYEYCLQDVRTEMAIDRQLREPTDEEWRDFRVNMAINERGIKVDLDFAKAAQQYAAEEEQDLINNIKTLTGGEVDKARGEKLKAWVVARLNKEQLEIVTKIRDGEEKISLDKYNRERLMAHPDLEPHVHAVIEASDFAQRSSVGKYRAMELRADPETHRVHNAMLCNGASQSGRYSSKGLQVHNFPRTVMDSPVEVREDFIDNIVPEYIVETWNAPMMTVLSNMLRASLIPEDDSVFLVSDWSAIEGRVAPWLADSPEGEEKLDLYRTGAPVYEITASHTFKVKVEDVSKGQRQVGKVQELSFQYQGGKNAFLVMARGYGLKAKPADAEIYKRAWRNSNPWAEQIWTDIEKAVKSALRKPETRFEAGRLSYFSVADVLCGGMTLFCQLPCGRLLTYPDARLDQRTGSDGTPEYSISCLRAAFTPKASEKTWPRSNLYGGELFNNAVQGTAASLLREALARCEEARLNPVLHVHDEIVLEVLRRRVAKYKSALHEIMNTPPKWAEGLPLHAEVEVMERFGK